MALDKEQDRTARVVDPAAVNRAVWSRVLQHPSTLAPLALCLLSGTYMGLIQLNKSAFAAAFAGGLLTLGSIVYHYFIRGEAHAEAVVAELMGNREQDVWDQFESLRQSMQDAGFSEGLTQVNDLRAVYLKLSKYLEGEQRRQDRPGIARFAVMARDCRAEGLRILQLALNTYQAVRQTQAAKLKAEREEWLRQAGLVKASIDAGNSQHQPRYEALIARAQAHERTLERYEKRRGELVQLLAQSEVLEAALESAYLDVVDLLEQKLPGSDDAVSRLENAVSAARAVEERLRAPSASASEDDEYLRAAGRL